MPVSPLSSLWSLTAGYRRKYFQAIAAMATGTIFLLLVPYVLKWALDTLTESSATVWGTLVPAAAWIILFHAIHGAFTYLRGRWAAEASEGIVLDLRHQLYSHLERLPTSFFDQMETGDLVQRCSSDVETIRVFLASQVVEIGRVSLFLMVAIPLMLLEDVRMTLVSLVIVPVIIGFAIVFFRRVRSLFEQIDEAEGRLTTVIQENLTGVRVVRAFGQQEYEIEKFMQRNGDFRDLEYELFRALSNYWSVSDVLCLSQLGVILIGGGYFVLQGGMSVGSWVMFFWLLKMIIWPIRHFGRVLADSGKATVAIGRVQEILDQRVEESVEVEELADASKLDQATGPPQDVMGPLTGDIVAEQLSFSYRDGTEALSKLDLHIPYGETVAILGPPGAGKSTLVNLLVRLYEYGQGSLRIGKQEVSSISRERLRFAFGIVSQDPFLYSTTVAKNLLVGDSEASQADLEEVTRAAAVHDNIRQFDAGFETSVGERGITLSGGQRQRLAIARAFLKQPSFLVLDDSLSAVDTRTETLILDSLAKRKGKQTTILITHRLSSTRLADRIFVIDEGTLTQQGTHQELVAQPGYYRRLWEIQNALENQISGRTRERRRLRHSGRDVIRSR